MAAKYNAIPTLISVKETARLLGISERMVRQLVHDGAVRSVKIGRSRKLHALPLLEYYCIDREEALNVLNAY